jgi:hypothetical protein
MVQPVKDGKTGQAENGKKLQVNQNLGGKHE